MTAAAADGHPPRVLVVWCPDWPVVATGDSATAPLAVLAAGRVVACSASARDAGVRRGQRVREAQHHCPALIAMPRDEAREARVFEQVLAVVEEFCPRLEVTRPGLCALGARGPARYFGGEESLAGRLAAAVADSGFACRIGIADGLFAGELAARTGLAGVIVPPGGTRRFLAEQPVTALGSADLADLLARLGIRTLGEFAALPAPGAADRFGASGSVAHRLARGLEPRPLATRVPPAALSLAAEFDPPAPQAEPVIFAAKALAEQMHAGLRDRGLACVRVEVAVTGSDGRQSARLWRHEGLLSALAVAERVRWQLDGWRGGGNSGDGSSGGITMLRLIPDQIVPDHGRQLGLWGEAQAGDRVSRAAMRVQAMLGHESVTHPVISGGRGPADQVTLAPFGDARPPRPPRDRPWPGSIPVPAPATVYPDPLPARVTDASGEAVTVTGRASVSAAPAWLAAGAAPPLSVIAWAGPWPVSEWWWEPAKARRRARFQMVTGDESAWLVTVQDGRWSVDASYD